MYPGVFFIFRHLHSFDICILFIVQYIFERANHPSYLASQTAPDNAIAAPDITNAGRVIPLGKTHGAMIRFSNADDRDYQIVSKCIKEMVVGAAKTATAAEV